MVVARMLTCQHAAVAELACGRVDAAVLDASKMGLIKALRSTEAVGEAQSQPQS